jgi:uncharacterized protein YegP (UPF0339 family)
MSGHFEVFASPEGGHRFRLLHSAGNHPATSEAYPTQRAAAAAIVTVREIAGTGLISDKSGEQVTPSDRYPAHPCQTGSEGRPPGSSFPRVCAWRWSPAH